MSNKGKNQQSILFRKDIERQLDQLHTTKLTRGLLENQERD
jgi:hypothetical protein